MASTPSEDDIALAHEIYEAWQNGESKGALERRIWNDGSSHGRHFDRFIRDTIGLKTTNRSKQSLLIEELQRQVRSLGAQPAGAPEVEWHIQLQQARASCLEALRIWNDPTGAFRTGAFSLLFVTAWNSIALAILQRDGREWQQPDGLDNPGLFGEIERSLGTKELINRALPGGEYHGTRENLALWIDLRNAVAHRHLPALDAIVIPWAQAGLLNTENVLVTVFGSEFALAERLSVPLQLSGFRDPGVLSSLKTLQASLPLDVQAVLARIDAAPAELLSDPTYMLRVAFLPAVPASGRNPDAVAYFVRPGEVPPELQGSLEEFVVMPKPMARPEFTSTEVVDEIRRRTGFRFNTNMHATVGRALGVRSPRNESEATLDPKYAEYLEKLSRHLYSQAWIDRLSGELADPERFAELTGRPAVPIERA